MTHNERTYNQFSQTLAAMKEQKPAGLKIQVDPRTGYMMGAVYYTHLYIQALMATDIYTRGLDKTDRRALADMADQMQGSIYTDPKGVRWYVFRCGSRLYAKTLKEWLTPSRHNSKWVPVDNWQTAHPVANLEAVEVRPFRGYQNISPFFAR